MSKGSVLYEFIKQRAMDKPVIFVRDDLPGVRWIDERSDVVIVGLSPDETPSSLHETISAHAVRITG